MREKGGHSARGSYPCAHRLRHDERRGRQALQDPRGRRNEARGLYNTVYEAALERVSASNFSKDADREDIARKITVATIKFGDLVNYCMKDYVFDMDKFMAPDGKTGSFLLYTIARINSILKKAEGAGEQFDSAAVYTDSERDLLLKISLSGEAFALAYREKAPSVICENAYQLASAFSKFYHDNHILTEEDADKSALGSTSARRFAPCLKSTLTFSA